MSAIDVEEEHLGRTMTPIIKPIGSASVLTSPTKGASSFFTRTTESTPTNCLEAT